ncbi:MAG: hypothetical protein J3K34DRAFT_416476 [Monoraphidium minutum]|nr:MAG: hypothetical protein J3K34DRAFT_416476 [Monoraphidium minutum]
MHAATASRAAAASSSEARPATTSWARCSRVLPRASPRCCAWSGSGRTVVFRRWWARSRPRRSRCQQPRSAALTAALIAAAAPPCSPHTASSGSGPSHAARPSAARARCRAAQSRKKAAADTSRWHTAQHAGHSLTCQPRSKMPSTRQHGVSFELRSSLTRAT